MTNLNLKPSEARTSLISRATLGWALESTRVGQVTGLLPCELGGCQGLTPLSLQKVLVELHVLVELEHLTRGEGREEAVLVDEVNTDRCWNTKI